MKTESYTTVLQNAAEFAGRVYADASGNVILSVEESNSLRVFMRRALVKAWDAAIWPELRVISKRTFAEPWSSDTTYDQGDIVFYPATGRYYVAINAAPTNIPPETFGDSVSETTLSNRYWAYAQKSYGAEQWDFDNTYFGGEIVEDPQDHAAYVCRGTVTLNALPSTDPARWFLLPEFDRYVDYDQDWEDQLIGDVYGIYEADPRRTTNSKPMRWESDERGILIRDQLPYVWVEFRLPVQDMTSDPATIPARFSEFAALYAAGMLLRVDGKVELGNQYLAMAEEALDAETYKVLRNEGQVRPVTVETYV